MRNPLREWKFLQLALCLAGLMIALPWIEQHLVFQIVFQLFLVNSLLVAISEEKKKSRLRTFLLVAWGLSVFSSILIWLPLPFDVHYAELFFFGALLVGCTVGILRFVFSTRRVTVDSIFGAVVAYLLVACAFAVLEMALLHADRGSFRLPDGANESTAELRADMLYFSLVTIVTLGYGDIVPATSVARMVAAFEGVVGQFYVAAVVAMLVGRFISQAIEEDKT
jgi:voltage-gated potassium channel